MHKTYLIVIAIFALSIVSCKDKTATTLQETTEVKSCNYITDYYQLIYQAELAFWQNDFAKAHDLLRKAENNCALLNQYGINEPMMMAETLVKIGQPEKAFPYIERMLKEGYGFSRFEDNNAFDGLHGFDQWEVLRAKEIDYLLAYRSSLNDSLSKEIMEMNVKDQEVRIAKLAPVEIDKVDSIHQARIKDIFKEYGYPGPKLVGNQTISQRTGLGTLFFHFSDTTYFKPVLLDFIKKGEAPADILGTMLDSRQRARGVYDYGIYDNIDSTAILDFKNLDKRRMSVGLPPWKLKKEKDSLVRAYFNIQ